MRVECGSPRQYWEDYLKDPDTGEWKQTEWRDAEELLNEKLIPFLALLKFRLYDLDQSFRFEQFLGPVDLSTDMGIDTASGKKVTVHGYTPGFGRPSLITDDVIPAEKTQWTNPAYAVKIEDVFLVVC